MNVPETGLSQAIEELRRELYEAQALSASQQFVFGIEEVQLELLLELRETKRGSGGFAFGVLTGSIGKEQAHAASHKLILKLSVKDLAAAGSSPNINDSESANWGDI